jgi:hypothetical protein
VLHGTLISVASRSPETPLSRIPRAGKQHSRPLHPAANRSCCGDHFTGHAMTSISGAIVLLAGAVLVAAGVIAEAVMQAASKLADVGKNSAMVGELALMTVGLVMLVGGLRESKKDSPL